MQYSHEQEPASNRMQVTAWAAAAGAFASGMALLFTLGRPMGWPLGWWFNAIFIGMGAIFIGTGTSDFFKERARHRAGQVSGSSVNGTAFMVVGLCILLMAVFMGAFFSNRDSGYSPTDEWAGKPPAVRACQSAPFHTCLGNGRYMGRFEGVYLAAVERSGRISDVKIQSKLPGASLKCLRQEILALEVKDYNGERMSVMCQFIGSSMPSVFKVSLNSGYRKLEPGETLEQPGPGDSAGNTQPVDQPNADVIWSEVLATPGCTFWSGPEKLGRDDKLGTTAVFTQGRGRATLLLGRSIAFSGSSKGRTLTLQRKSRHEGTRWDVTETITLMRKGKLVLAGNYQYTECDNTGQEGCPGKCRIRASVEIREHK